MRLKPALLLILIVFVAACKEVVSTRIPPSRMVPILVDLHLADAYAGMFRDTTHPNMLKNYDSLAVWTTHILARHNSSLQEFNSSMDWYRDHPTDLDSLYAQVVPALERCVRK